MSKIKYYTTNSAYVELPYGSFVVSAENYDVMQNLNGELLEALELLLEETDPMKLNTGEPWCRVRSAIAKARGE